MYAIVEIAGQQFKVEKDQEIFVHRLDGDAGSTVEFDNVLLYDNDGKISVGTPTVDGMMVKAKIVEHLKGDKVLVFHKKRRKGYQKQNGHRQYLSKIVIEDILAGVKKAKKEEPKKETPKKTAEVKAEPKKAAKETAKKEAPKAKKATPKKADDKPATKKAEPKKTTKETASKTEAKPKAEVKKETKAEAKPEKKETKVSKSEEKNDDQ